MPWVRVAVVLTFACVLTGGPIAGAQELTSATLVVDLRAAEGNRPWVAHAFEATIRHELSSFERFKVQDRRDVEHTCGVDDRQCRLSTYRDANIDLVLFGEVDATRFVLEVWDTGMARKIAHGKFELVDTPTVARVRRRVLSMMAPLIESGGWLDRRAFFLQEQTSALVVPPVSLVRVLLSVIVATFGLPLLALWLWARRRKLPLTRSRASIFSVVMVTPAMLLLLATFIPTSPASDLEQLLGRAVAFAGVDRLAALLGGFGWGAFLMLNLQLLIPSLYGIERADHRALGKLLRSWFLALGLRSLRIALLYAPFGLGLWAVAGWLDVPGETTWTILAPLVGLAAYFWLFTVSDALAEVLDALRVEGSAGPDNAWHRGVTRYFEGYLKRGGIDVPGSVRERLRFLPTNGKEVMSYGGGFSDARILIPLPLLELALGAPPDGEQEIPRHFCDVDDWTAGTLVPGHPAPASGTDREVAEAVRRPDVPLRSLGESTSVLGWVMPLARDDATPLLANTREDFEAVQELLTEHYKRFIRREWDEEHDDTDPNQLDFLFAALLYEIGAIRRSETVWNTWALFIAELLAVAPAGLAKAARLMAFVVRPFRLDRAPVVAESYPALNLARHPMIQFLYYQLTGDQAPLTARADALRLASTSRTLLLRVFGEDRFVPQSTRERQLLERLAWLGQPLGAETASVQRRTGRYVLGAIAVVAIVALGVHEVQRAVEYAPEYEKRMTEQRRSAKENKDNE